MRHHRQPKRHQSHDTAAKTTAIEERVEPIPPRGDKEPIQAAWGSANPRRPQRHAGPETLNPTS